MKKIKYGCWLVATLIFVTLILNMDYVYRPFKIIYYLQAYHGFILLMAVMSVLFVIVNLLAAIGLVRMQWWGFVMAYTAILFSSIICVVSYIPFLLSMVSPQYEFLALAVPNISLLAFVIYLHLNTRYLPMRKTRKLSRKKKLVSAAR